MTKRFSTLADWMDAKGHDDQSLAALLPISRSQVSRLRRRKCRPTIETARVVEGLTGIPAAKLVMGEA